ncbi:MAG: TRAP transporter small permease subunit [Geminicoccaceae bacterium]|nr:MAG: TRAP transporter small permease subunit [Geminicoccaceae bacterium]
MATLRLVLLRLSEGAAILGGLVLTLAMLVTVTSVVQARFGRPILGDTEIVSLAAGIAIALFMPYCQMRGGHVVVGVFTGRLPERGKALLDALMALAMAVVVAVVTWRLMQGGLDAYHRGRSSMFLNLPNWWGFAGASVGLGLWTLTAFFTAAERWRLLVRRP